MILVNGIAGDSISARDRGLAYGDGVFRTFVFRSGRPVLWERQYAKLAHDCAALEIEAPAREALEADFAQIRGTDCVVKVMVTRGEGMRGYAPPAAAKPCRIVLTSELPQYPAEYATQGIDVRMCALRLAPQPRLAGSKHLNRLENVLARAEWSNDAFAEGILCDVDGNLVGGTMTNLFIVKQHGLFTPELGRCGVKGVMRDLVIELAEKHRVAFNARAMSVGWLRDADAAFVVNSVIGVWPIARVDGKSLPRQPLVAQIQEWVRDAQGA